MKPALILLLCLVAASAAAPVQAAPTRDIADAPLPGAEFVVTLNLSGITAGGIVETVPPGFTFVSTAHPPGRVSIKGQQVSFVVLNDTVIRYRVRAPDAGSGTFCGAWEDFITMEHGSIAETPIAVSSAPENGSGAPTETPGLPGWTAATALCALGVAAFFRGRLV